MLMRQSADIIGALARRVDGIASVGFRQTLMSAMAGRIKKLILDGFAQERDPTGKPWAARIGKHKGDWPILNTGRKDSALKALTVRPSDVGVVVTTNAYMQYHLTGTKARKWIPTKPEDLHPIWRPALQRIYADTLMERIRANG